MKGLAGQNQKFNAHIQIEKLLHASNFAVRQNRKCCNSELR